MKKVFGVGINDSDCPTQKFSKIDGKNKLIWICPYYRKWKDMLKRCYYQTDFRTYDDCYVCDEWLLFSNFKGWCLSQNITHEFNVYHLDKDITLEGNKEYSPEHCNLVLPIINTFILGSDSIRGDLPIGVSRNKCGNKYEAYCRNPFIKRKQEYLGVFETPEQAHETWKKRKYEHAIALIEGGFVENDSVAKSLLNRYKINP